MSPVPPLPPPSEPIVVKVLGRVGDTRHLSRQVPLRHPLSQRVRFEFDLDARRYDWLAVYDNLPSRRGERFPQTVEELPCPQENSILLTSEPTSVKIYGRAFVRQFGAVVTSQEHWAIRAPKHIWGQSGLRWFYGIGRDHLRTADEIIEAPPLAKTRGASIVCSTKAHGHTLHRQRYEFSMALARAMPELDHYGRGVRPIDDKAEALDAYRYHVAIENHIAPHHWSEKLADAFLGCTLPFYCGAPDAGNYFPPESFIAIDLASPERVAARIRQAIADDEYEKRLPYILEARRRVIEDYNMMALIARHVEANHCRARRGTGRIVSQRLARRRNLPFAAEDFAMRLFVKSLNRVVPVWR